MFHKCWNLKCSPSMCKAYSDKETNTRINTKAGTGLIRNSKKDANLKKLSVYFRVVQQTRSNHEHIRVVIILVLTPPNKILIKNSAPIITIMLRWCSRVYTCLNIRNRFCNIRTRWHLAGVQGPSLARCMRDDTEIWDIFPARGTITAWRGPFSSARW